MDTDRKAQNGPEPALKREAESRGVDRVFGFPLESGSDGGTTVWIQRAESGKKLLLLHFIAIEHGYEGKERKVLEMPPGWRDSPSLSSSLGVKRISYRKEMPGLESVGCSPSDR